MFFGAIVICWIFAGDEAAPVVDAIESPEVGMESVIELQKSSQI